MTITLRLGLNDTIQCAFFHFPLLFAPLSGDNQHANAEEWMDFKALPSEKVMFNMAKFSNESQERTIFG